MIDIVSILLQGSLGDDIVGKASMCIQKPGTVRTIEGAFAIMEDGRKVRLGPLQGIRVGDCLEVYADVALGKMNEDNENNENNKVTN
jgi:hypothetical protein